MNLLPIVERELRLSSRRAGSYWARSLTGLTALTIALGTIVMQLSAGALPGEIGGTLFRILSLVCFGMAFLSGPFITADALSSEKRNGGMDLLVLTRLRPTDIVLGKLASTALPALSWPLAIVPVIALCFPIGGVSIDGFIHMASALAACLTLSLSAGLFLSALCRNPYRAIGGTLLLLLAISAIPLVPVLWTKGPNAAILLSPAYACWLSLNPAPPTQAGYFASGIACLFIQSGLFLFLAVKILPSTWRIRDQKPVSRQSSGLSNRKTGAPAKSRSPNDALETNPILWLATRRHQQQRLRWALACIAFLGATPLLRHLPQAIPRGPFLFFGLFALHSIVKLWVARVACHRFAEDRQSGALELLLTSPLAEQAIICGWLDGLKRRFAAPIIAIAATDLILFLTGLSTNDTALDIAFLATIGLLIADTYTLAWVGFWCGLSAQTPTKAFYRAIGLVLVLPWVGFLGILGAFGVLSPGAAGPPSIDALALLWFVIGYLANLMLCGWAISKLTAGFREATVARSEPPNP